MAGVQISNIATKQDLMCGANHLNVAYVSSNDYTVSGMIECAGAWYRFVDEPVTVTTSDYIKMIPVIGATPGTNTATLAAITSFSGVAFDTDKNGYYVTGTDERVFAYRDLTTTIFLVDNESRYIPGSVTIGANISVLGNITADTKLIPPNTSDYINYDLSGLPGAVLYTLPRGFYMIICTAGSVEIKDSGSTWYTFFSTAGFVMSDGTNVRLYGADSATARWKTRKFSI